MNETSTPRIGVIGAGPWGKNHVRNFHTLGALRAVCDTNPAAIAAATSGLTGVAGHTSAESFFSAKDIDAVVIATPAATHGGLVARAVAAGKHVLVEKPLCLDVEEADRLARQAKQSGLLLMVGHLLLYHPAFRAVLNLARTGALGKLRYVYSNRLSLGRIRKEENALWSFAPHDISMILALATRMPNSVTATAGYYVSKDVADTTLSQLSFDDGMQAHVFVSWLHPYKDHRMVVVGSDAMVSFDDTRTGAEKVQMYRHAVGWNGEVPILSRANAEPVPYGDEEPLQLECRTFLDCIRTGTVPPSDANEGIRVLRVLDACQKAIGSGTRIELPRNT